jgi:hypothetical protein
MGRSKLTDIQWKLIETMYISGVSARKIAEDYPSITHEAIAKRAKRGRWRTAEILRREANELLSQADGLDKDGAKSELMKKEWKSRREEHLLKTYERMNTVLDNVDYEELKVKGMHDLNLADQIMRRTVGLDETGKTEAEAKEAAAPIINVSLFEAVKPMSPVRNLDDVVDV